MTARCAPRAARPWRWLAWLAGLVLASIFIASCASQAPANVQFDQETTHWSGRLALRLDAEPPQSYAAGFELDGNPQAGELTLTSPLGSILAVMRWHNGEAVLRQGEQTRRYDSLDALVQDVTGTPLPVRALFGWLRGDAQPVPGWQPELSQLGNGRLTARRLMPLPTAELRLVLDR